MTASTNPRNSVFGKRQLNRFSWFVTTGAEEFLLTGGNTLNSKKQQPDTASAQLSSVQDLCDKSPPSSGGSLRYQQQSHGVGSSVRSHSGEKIVEESDDDDEVTESDKHYILSGPSWQEKAPLFSVRVHDPETKRKMVGMQEYTLFQVTSTVCVHHTMGLMMRELGLPGLLC